MVARTFSYYALMGNTGSREITSLLAALVTTSAPAQGVVWSIPDQGWMFSPKATAYFLYDQDNFDMSYSIDRVTAEQLALQVAHVELPSEDELRRICAEGLVVWLAEEEALEDDDDEDLENEVFDDDAPPQADQR